MSAGKQATFIFGSGISFPSKMPSTTNITDSIFSGSWWYHTDGAFYSGAKPSPIPPDRTTPKVVEFLKYLNCYAEDCLKLLACGEDGTDQLVSLRRRPNYEDLYSLAEQATGSFRHVPNLATIEFIRRCRGETRRIHDSNFGINYVVGRGFENLASVTTDFLHAVVRHNLIAPVGRPVGLSLLSEVARTVDILDIFTLNHDTLVERQFEADGIEFETGFDDLCGDIAMYRPGWWRRGRRANIRLFKLHGSVNWWSFDLPDGTSRQGIPCGVDPSRAKLADGRSALRVASAPSFLSGTVVKERRYPIGIWRDQFDALRDNLSRHSHLLCSGYGFRDDGLNLQLADWLATSRESPNRLIVLTPQRLPGFQGQPLSDSDSEAQTDFLDDKPLWLRQKAAESRVIPTAAYLQNCTLDDISTYFDPI